MYYNVFVRKTLVKICKNYLHVITDQSNTNLYVTCKVSSRAILTAHNIIVTEKKSLPFQHLKYYFYFLHFSIWKNDKLINKMYATIRGTFHQGDIWVFPPESVGKQCVANCAMAIIYISVMPVDQLQSEHLDCILVTGNKLYLTIHSSHDYLIISDIPDVVTEYGGYYNINKYKEMFGTLGENEINVGTNLIDAIHLMVNKDIWTYGILCLGHMISGSASALLILGNDCYIFHPHSRDSTGKPIEGGTSVLLHFHNVQECCVYIKQLGNIMNCNQYELTLIKISNILNKCLQNEMLQKETNDNMNKAIKICRRKEYRCPFMKQKCKNPNYREQEKEKQYEYVIDQKHAKFMTQNMHENQNQIEDSSKRKQHMIKKYTTNSKIVQEQHIVRERRKNHSETKLHDTCTSHQTVYASKQQDRNCSSIAKKCVQ